jgi:Domain of unknown function (DUF5667)
MTRPFEPPDEGMELDPMLLEVLAELRGTSRDQRRRAAGRAAVMAAAARGREAARRRPLWRRRAAITALGFAGANLALGGVVALAAGAQPDSVFYGVKRAAEAAKLSLTFDPVDKARLELQLADRRADEAATMARTGHAGLALDAARDATSLVREASATLAANPSVDNEQALAHASAEARARLQQVFAALESGADPGAAEAARGLDSAWSNGLGNGVQGDGGQGHQGQGPGGAAAGSGGGPGGGSSGKGGAPATSPGQSGEHGAGAHGTHTPQPGR